MEKNNCIFLLIFVGFVRWRRRRRCTGITYATATIIIYLRRFWHSFENSLYVIPFFTIPLPPLQCSSRACTEKHSTYIITNEIYHDNDFFLHSHHKFMNVNDNYDNIILQCIVHDSLWRLGSWWILHFKNFTDVASTGENVFY